ncbi:hypothetical protein [Vibrio agarivorans]|uniref:CopL family metal-binding regulatory protein n=1 Tax=Vibrio agarivorans TaxID=153622 RepID=A0ABT7Y6N2_9VIBR|nr:hypothetical protein [Vibrio agarivorans]MDN2483660.1 hypothetical protein [Vibrio agarivorans]
MTHSMRTLWITLISIAAMLMSAYVSSAPAMTLQVGQHTTHPATMAHCHSASNQHHDDKHDHEHSHEHSAHHVMPSDSVQAGDCDNQSHSVHSCCTSVCSSVSYPIATANITQPTLASLALHHPITIGDAQTRPRLLLRPPSI